MEHLGEILLGAGALISGIANLIKALKSKNKEDE